MAPLDAGRAAGTALGRPAKRKPRIRSVLRDLIWEQFPELRHGCIGFYWPFRAEIDLRHLVRDFLALGAEAALPVVVEKRQPLEFWAWRPRMKLARGIWNIPIPAEPNAVRPAALLVVGRKNSIRIPPEAELD